MSFPHPLPLLEGTPIRYKVLCPGGPHLSPYQAIDSLRTRWTDVQAGWAGRKELRAQDMPEELVFQVPGYPPVGIDPLLLRLDDEQAERFGTLVEVLRRALEASRWESVLCGPVLLELVLFGPLGQDALRQSEYLQGISLVLAADSDVESLVEGMMWQRDSVVKSAEQFIQVRFRHKTSNQVQYRVRVSRLRGKRNI